MQGLGRFSAKLISAHSVVNKMELTTECTEEHGNKGYQRRLSSLALYSSKFAWRAFS